MIRCQCIKKYRDYNGNIFQFVLQDEYGKVLNIDKDELKSLIRNKQFNVVNLTLTSDNRLIDKKYEYFDVSRRGKVMESYNDLNRRIRRQEADAKQQLADRIENIHYLDITDDNNTSLGFIYTKEIEKMLIYIEKLYNQINIKESQTVLAEEIFYTCTIEGANTTIKKTEQIMQGYKPKDYSEKMVANSYNATKYLNLVSQGSLITEKELFKTWDLLTKDACENSDLRGDRYRIGDVTVGSVYTPPSSDNLEWLMNKYFEFMHNTSDNIHILVKAAILHFYFVFIHPFCDGNGRTTRLITTDYLIRSGLEKFKAISLSKEIHNTVNDYQKALLDSENEYNDITFFIEYYLTVIQNTLEDIHYAVNNI